ncbi:MAG TPA: dipeptide ABC transporter ATP-binding protein [Clostridia bacterium]|nr:dipeptide ABC transporter ATP-binding protein [Clostridia bacterium]
MPETGKKLLEIKNLTKHFDVKKGFMGTSELKVKAVDGVSFFINKGETMGLVGESGCGKTTVGRTIIRLYEPTSGQILYNEKDITKIDMKPLRKKMQMIFQDPYASLNPRMTVADIVSEPMDIHKIGNKKQNREKVLELLEMVELNKEHANRYPHEFSGGQRQRIGIARALAVDPEFIICDEPISALDVSIQAQIVNMLEDLQKSLGLTYLFIAHDLSMVKHISDRIGVMYLGKLVETTESKQLYEKSAHPYTQALLSAIPIADPKESRKRSRIILEGDVPSPINPPSGCKFRTRCVHAMKKCAEQEPELKEIAPGHFCACHLY